MTQPTDGEDFFGGAKSFSFKAESWRGKPRGGRIIEPPRKVQQRDFKTGDLKFWNDGNPAMQLVITVDTRQGKHPEIDPSVPGDDGVRRLFIKGQMIEAFKIAFRKSGAKGLREGGEAYVAWISDEVIGGGNNDKKIYAAEYTPPVAGAETDSVFGGTSTQPAPELVTAPPAAAQPAADPWAPLWPTAPVTAPPAVANPFA